MLKEELVKLVFVSVKGNLIIFRRKIECSEVNRQNLAIIPVQKSRLN